MAGRTKKRSKFVVKGLSDYEKMTNVLMQSGRKTVSRKIVDEALKYIDGHLEELNQKMATFNQDVKIVFKTSLQVLSQAVQNIAPIAEVRHRRIGGAVYPVPIEVSENRRKSIAMRWIRDAIRNNRGGVASSLVLAKELMSATSNEGMAIKKKEDIHKQVESAKAFSHFSMSK